jgi:hypothetical protein
MKMLRFGQAPLNLIPHRRHFALRLVEERQHILGPRLAGTPLEEVRGGFDHADLLGNGDRNPLVERYAVLLGQPRGGGLDRGWQLERVGRLGHDRNSAGMKQARQWFLSVTNN